MREWINRRYTEDLIESLINEMQNEDPTAFRNFIRMSGNLFDSLLHKVGPLISKQDRHLRKSIPAKTRLIITLRFLEIHIDC